MGDKIVFIDIANETVGLTFWCMHSMMRRLLVLLCLCALTFALQHPVKQTKYGPKHRATKDLPRGGRATSDYLLPTDIYPVSYDVTIIPYLETELIKPFTFDGTVTTRLNVVVGTNKIVMHAWDLNINTISLRKVDDLSVVGILNWDILLDDRQFFTINLDAGLQAGSLYDLTISYSGVINDELYGLYRYSYVDVDGSTVWMAVTDSEPTGARRIVPWFDQPNFKARITLNVAREPGRQVIANMPILSEGDPVNGLAGWEWVHFEDVPPISTYIFCFSIHKYANITDPNDSRFTLYARPSVVQNGQYALSLSSPVLKYYESIFNIPYSLPKLDSLSLISFAWGGMENWGLITYLERIIQYNSSSYTIWNRKQTATLVAHEIAHQWFGNLVSPDWWSNTWLSEGFATYYEAHWNDWQGTAEDWQLNEQFVVDYVHSAFRTDANTDTHPLYANVDSPNSISNNFDGITYDKGGSIVRFMSNFIGEDNFRLGLNNYLQSMQYNAAEQSDLFRSLTQYAPQMPTNTTFALMMESWTLQAGYPLVTVTRDYNTHTATITQERFGSMGSEQWIIPLTMTTAASPNFDSQTPQAWFLPGQKQISIADPLVPSDLQWLILNVRQTGFYRVNYDETNWALIATFLGTPGSTTLVAPENRAQFMDDALTLAKVGRLSYNTALRTTAYLYLETRLTPWLSATNSLEYIRDRVYQTSEGVTIFQAYMRHKLETVYGSVNGFQSTIFDSPATLFLRWEVTRWSCDSEYDVCNTDGRQLFLQWKQIANPDVNNPIEVDMRSPAYCAGQRKGDITDYNFLMARYQASASSNERERLLNGMGCSSDPIILQLLLDSSLNTNLIQPSEAIDALEAVSYNPAGGVDLALDFVILNWQALDPIYGNIGIGFDALRDKLNTQQQYDKILQFRNDHVNELSAASLTLITSTLSTLDATMQWNFSYLSEVMNYFRTA